MPYRRPEGLLSSTINFAFLERRQHHGSVLHITARLCALPFAFLRSDRIRCFGHLHWLSSRPQAALR